MPIWHLTPSSSPKEGGREMKIISYTDGVRSMMNGIMCSRPHLEHVVNLAGLSSYTSKHFFCTSKTFLNFQNILWPSKKIHGHHTPKNTSRCRLSKVKIYDFHKSKYITTNQLPEVKIYNRKSTSKSQIISPEVKNHYRKSKNITGSRLPEIKKLSQF